MGALPQLPTMAWKWAAFFGEATGNGGYSALDGFRILRVVVGLDSGYAAYPFVDPVLLTDITGNGIISSLDGTRILQEVWWDWIGPRSKRSQRRSWRICPTIPVSSLSRWRYERPLDFGNGDRWTAPLPISKRRWTAVPSSS